MKSSFFILIAISASVFSTADAHNKVVVIPMNDNSIPIRIYGNITASVPSSGTAAAVRTRDANGVLDDTDFHFTMICPKL